MSEIKSVCPLCHQVEEEVVTDDKPCVKCQEDMKKGFLLIGVDFLNSESAENPLRTGHRWIIHPDGAKALYKPESLAKGAGFLDIRDASIYGLSVAK